MKQTKQQIINDLVKENERLTNKNKFLTEIFEKIEKTLLGRCNFDVNSILEEIIRIKQQNTAEGKILPIVDWTIKEENSKLWYLIRLAMKDETIKEPMYISRMESKFKKPDFN